MEGLEGYVIQGKEQIIKRSQNLIIFLELWFPGLIESNFKPDDFIDRLEIMVLEFI